MKEAGAGGEQDYESWIWLLPIHIDKVTQSHKTWHIPPKALIPSQGEVQEATFRDVQ